MRRLVLHLALLCLIPLASCGGEDAPVGAPGGSIGTVDAVPSGQVGFSGHDAAGATGVDVSASAADAGTTADATSNATDGGSDVPPGSPPAIEIVEPTNGTITPEGTPLRLVARATTAMSAATELSVEWSSDVDGPLGASGVNEHGHTETIAPALSRGPHGITARAVDSAGRSTEASVRIGVCGWLEPEPFDADLQDGRWQIFGDAYWDEGGWLEMTGNETNRKGAIYNVDERVDAGDVSIAFRIWTGEGIRTGADGFAMSIIDASSTDELTSIVNAAGTGSCLGYDVAGTCGSSPIRAFHVEFDTYHNGDAGDPPDGLNHVAVMLNGDSRTHHLVAAVPNIEDSQWHDIEIDLDGAHITVRLDGASVIGDVIEGLDFTGGYIGFSGTTGAETNFHRFDDLRITEKRCRIK